MVAGEKMSAGRDYDREPYRGSGGASDLPPVAGGYSDRDAPAYSADPYRGGGGGGGGGGDYSRSRGGDDYGYDRGRSDYPPRDRDPYATRDRSRDRDRDYDAPRGGRDYDAPRGGRDYDAPRGGGSDRGPCYDFQKGTCTRGDGCRFSHGSGGGGGGGSSYGDRGGGYGDRGGGSRGGGPCYAFQKGTCDRGSSCRCARNAVLFALVILRGYFCVALVFAIRYPFSIL